MLQAFPSASGPGKLELHLLATVFMQLVFEAKDAFLRILLFSFFLKKFLQLSIKSGALDSSTNKEKQAVSKAGSTEQSSLGKAEEKHLHMY